MTTTKDTTTPSPAPALVGPPMAPLAKPGNGTAKAAATTPATAAYALIPIKRLHPATWNPRQVRNKAADEELRASILDQGVIEPIVVRPHESGYQVVAGTRRYEQAKGAGLTEIPCMIRQLTDREVLELQTVENSQREDVHPLEEAEAYRKLRDEHHASPEEIAARVGKSRTWVYTRIALCKLGAPARKAFLEGKLDASTAMLVARIGDPTQQQAAAAELAKVDNYTGQHMSYRRAVEYVQSNFMLKLDGCGFKTTDAALVPGAGPCSTCAKRTGNQRELFADVKSPDVCTDAACFKRKQEAAWAQRAAAAKDAGQAVLAPEQAAKVFAKYGDGNMAHGAPFVDLDGEEYVGDKRQKWRAILGKAAPEPTLARDARGKVHELLPLKEALDAAKTAGKKVGFMGSAADNGHMAARDKKVREEQRRRREVTKRVIAAVVATATKLLATLTEKDLDIVFRFLAQGFLEGSWHDTLTDVAKRRGLVIGKKSGGYGADPTKPVRDAVNDSAGGELRALVVEVLATRGAYSDWERNVGGSLLTKACELLKLDRKKLEAEARAEIGAKAKGKVEKPAKKVPPAKAKKPAAKKPVKKGGKR